MPRTVRRWSPLVQSEIISRLSLALLLSRLCGTAVAMRVYIYIHIYFFLFSLPIPPRAFRTAPLPLFYIHSPSLDPSVHLCSPLFSLFRYTAALRGELFARAFHSRSLVLSLSFVGRNTLLSVLRRVGRSLASSLARVPSTLLPVPPTHPTHASGSVSSVPFASFSNLRRQCCAAVTRSERGGPGPETRGAAMLTRSARSPRLASLCLASLVALLRRARRGASCPPPLPPCRWTLPRRCC